MTESLLHNGADNIL